ncbi:MAG TPA: hypothetical protein DCM40_10560, partial [Maribacter sp.]|nr:hypothetical protein [Maribacter sp.]
QFTSQSFKYVPAGESDLKSGQKTPSAIINGETVLEKPYTFNFEIQNSQPEHLSYFCICTVDISGMASSFDLTEHELNAIFEASDQAYGVSPDLYEHTHVTVIDGGATSYTEDAYYLPNGQKWEGPVHNHEGQWMAGSKHTNEPHPNLTRKMVSSTLVKDFRDLTDLSFTKDEFYKTQSILTNFLGTEYEEKLANEIVINKKEVLSYDLISYAKESVGILLGLDMKKMTEQYAHLSKITLGIKNISLYRKNLLIETADVLVGPPVGQPLLYGMDSNKYTFFHFNDEPAPGKYGYYAEVELDSDKHIKYVDDVIASLKALLKDLDDYYTSATGFIFEGSNNIADKNVGALSQTEDFDLEVNKKVSMFDSYLGKYNPQFKQNTTEIYKKVKTAIASNIIQTLFSSFYGGQNTLAMSAAIHHTHGSPDGIATVSKIFANILQDFEKIYGGKTTNPSYGQDHTQKTATKGANLDKIIINLNSEIDLISSRDFGYRYLPSDDLTGMPTYSKDSFNKVLETKIDKYFNKELGQSKGLLFDALGTFGNAYDTKYSYVTTNSIEAGKENYTETDANSKEEDKAIRTLLSIIDYNVHGVSSKHTEPNLLDSLMPLGIMPQITEMAEKPDFTTGVKKPKELKVEQEAAKKNFKADYNGKKVMITDDKSSRLLFTMIKNSDEKFSQMESIKFYDIDKVTPDQSEKQPEKRKLYFSDPKERSILGQMKKRVNVIMGASAENDATGVIGAYFETQMQKLLKTMPHQIKALTLSSRGPNNGPPSPVQSVGYFKRQITSKDPDKDTDPRISIGKYFMKHWFNFENIARIEFLSGFENNAGSPQWQTLKDLPTDKSKTLLCRLVKYENKVFNITRPKVLELPIYNE